MSAEDYAPLDRLSEFARLLAKVEQNQGEAARYLSRAAGRPVSNVQVSRWAGGQTKVPVEIMDAMRAWADRPQEAPGEADGLTETSSVVPLFGYANAAGSLLRLNDDQRIGAVAIHPAQVGSRRAFAFIVFGDSLSPMLNHGDTGYAIRNRTPKKGQPFLIELATGESLVKLFVGIDERTLFAEQLTPKRDLSFPLRDVAAVHAVVGITFG